MIATLLALSLAPAQAAEGPAARPDIWEHEPMLRHDVAAPLPTGDPSFHGVFDLEDLVIVRPQGTELATGFTTGAFSRAIEAAVADRPEVDFVCVMHSDQLPTQFDGAAAFHLTYNNAALQGTGKYHALNPDIATKAALWMSYPSYWDGWDPGQDVWVFGQEMGHYWASFTRYDDGSGLSWDLLGRADSHWSWFLDTPNSPMEGNPWIDNGDGTFTTDAAAPARFSDLDLYLMGLIPAEDVAPMTLILPDPGTTDRVASSPPEYLRGAGDQTISGVAVSVTVDQVIAVEGSVDPAFPAAPTDFTILPILVVGPQEIPTQDLVDRVRQRHADWAAGWSTLTTGLSTVSFEVPEPRLLPEPDDGNVLVPRGAR